MTKERPHLPGLVNNQTTAIEEFQNITIRPIIKMQHHLLIALFRSYLIKRKINFSILSEDEKKAKIKITLQKDLQFKSVILGIVIGHFSIDELYTYDLNNSDYNKRILNITIKRLQDSLIEL
jgi:hypothetical protein|tara:strand:- start:33 stop:398 length:366 start_codon:yes stop_codon:yes gene_type:complete